VPYPVTTSRETLETVVNAIRRVSDADILFLEGNPDGVSMNSIYRTLSYDFPRVLTLNVQDCSLVEVENPLNKAFVLNTFWLPNVVLSCDYLITIAPFEFSGGRGGLSIENLLSLLPLSKYQGDNGYGWNTLYELGIDKVLADLYFTLPFDLGVVDARKRLSASGDCGHILVGEPYQVDCEAAGVASIEKGYLKLIRVIKAAS
jgi:hypothetical protein